MRKPEESLDDYIVKAMAQIPPEPPRPVVLRLTGEVEVLKPLAQWERPAKIVRAVDEPTIAGAIPRLSWFHRSLVMGGGLALAGLVFASAIVIGVSDAVVEPEVAQIDFIEATNDGAPSASRDEGSSETDIPLASDIFSTTDSRIPAETPAYRKRKYRAAASVRTPVRKTITRDANEPPQSLVAKFVPTTLVIYIENGLIKSRTEPWPAAGK